PPGMGGGGGAGGGGGGGGMHGMTAVPGPRHFSQGDNSMRYLVPAFAALLLTAAPALAEGPAAPGKDPAQAEKIYHLLKQQKDLEIKDQPLPKALETLSELLGVSFQLDPLLNMEIPGLVSPV